MKLGDFGALGEGGVKGFGVAGAGAFFGASGCESFMVESVAGSRLKKKIAIDEFAPPAPTKATRLFDHHLATSQDSPQRRKRTSL